jgi:two-component system sensor histidine kinase TctE
MKTAGRWPRLHHRRNSGRRSLRRRLLAFLLIPLTLVMLGDAALTYSGALLYSNHVHDRDLSDTALTLAQLLNSDSSDSTATVSSQARFLLEYDPDGRNYFSVRSVRYGPQVGSDNIPLPPRLPGVTQPPAIYSTFLGRRQVRAASMVIVNPHDGNDQLILTVAETLRDRHEVAREILLLTIPAQGVLLLSVLALVWFGVSRGLRELEPLTARLAQREHDLAPVGDADVPEEILPLTRTIDDLFARLRGMLSLQERFIADAAHQLRTPLAGLRVHAERAQKDRRPETLDDALGHIERLTGRATRTSGQLLALTRAQSQPNGSDALKPVDLSKLAPETVSARVHEALASGIDLGYEGSTQPLWVLADALTLQELLDNLIDNCLRYAGRGAIVTVAVNRAGANGVRLSVEDNGPGVPPAFLARLGERFFRVPGNAGDGTGLGLAIVRRIAERHRASVRHLSGSHGGLRVEVHFPLADNPAQKNGGA